MLTLNDILNDMHYTLFFKTECMFVTLIHFLLNNLCLFISVFHWQATIMGPVSKIYH